MKWNLNIKLMLLCIGNLVVFGTWISISYTDQVNKNEQQITSQFSSHATSLSARIAAQFYERYGDVQAFAKNSILQNQSDRSGIQATLDDYVKLYGIYDLIVYVDMKGKYIASNSKTFSGQKISIENLSTGRYAFQPWFQAVSAGRFSEDEAKGFTGTFVEPLGFDYLMGSATGVETYTQGFSTIVYGQNGKPIGAITNRTDSRYIQGELSQAYEELKKLGHETSEITLIDKKGNVILEFDPSLMGSMEFKNNPEVLGVLNLVEKKVPGALAIVNKNETGSGLFMNSRKNIEQVAGFAPISGKKWLDSLGWGVIVQNEAAKEFASLEDQKHGFLLKVIIFLSVCCAASYFLISKLSKHLASLTEKINITSRDVTKASETLASASQQLATSSQEQSSSVEQTSSSLEQISAIVSSSVKTSQEAVEHSKNVASLVTNSAKSMADLQISVQKIAEANERVESLAKLIEEIGEKTELIDEIVFQTRLLSFNASVEAERAGEHGRGFAVVAQEIGNLAQMSGKSAHEIGRIVKSSMNEAQEVVKSNRTRVEDGVALCKQTAEKLHSIQEASKAILKGSEQILRSSEEQNSGIQQINQSINLISRATEENASSAEECSASSQALWSQGESLTTVVAELERVVHGKWVDAENEEDVSQVGKQRLPPVVRQAASRAPKKYANKTAINSVEKSLRKPIKKATVSRAQRSFTEGNLATDLRDDPWEKI